jgi:hypothetical protein
LRCTTSSQSLRWSTSRYLSTSQKIPTAMSAIVPAARKDQPNKSVTLTIAIGFTSRLGGA